MTDITYKSPDGLHLYAKACGPNNAPVTVLCMHGLTRNHKDFVPMIDAIGGERRYICVDVRGRGRSERAVDPSTYSPVNYAGDMIALMDQAEIEKAVLIGTSMGGLMAMLMAKALPERIQGIVLNDIGPKVEQAGLKRIAAYTGNPEPVETWSDAANRTAQSQSVAFPDYNNDDWVAFARRTWREIGNGQICLDYDPAITRSLGEAKPGRLANFAMWRLFASMRKIPLLIVRGETSDVLSTATAKRMVRRHKDARLVEVPGRGHTPMLDEKVAVAAITQFLEKIEASL
jgi:pimeloyl-ACP methyl ester carboxylesterase